MNNINFLYRSNTFSSLLNDAATTMIEMCDNSQYNLKRTTNNNNNTNTCSCMLHLVLLQVFIYVSIYLYYVKDLMYKYIY